MKRFKKLNNIVGWVVCAIACAVYLMTIEPTASFWDCGEFIATSYKMEIGHPPGAPFFMMMGRICSLFASDPSQVAAMVNSFSALCSGFTILFLFWTITHLARRIEVSTEDFKNNAEISLGKTIGILGAGVVGALAYTFSDTFWFSAVEGEVYAASSLFTAVVYWCMLKWEDCADEPFANRWLVLIAYLMGLSIGVHLLNLLSIPVLGLVYYYRKSESVSAKGTLVALIVSCVVLVCILYGLIPGFAQVAGWFELLFVNGFGLPYNTGVVVYALALLGVLVWAIILTLKTEVADKSTLKKIMIAFVASIVLLGIPFFGSGTSSHLILAGLIVAGLIAMFTMRGEKVRIPLLNTILLSCGMVLLGYMSYAPLVIRSAANPTMDENSPDDVFALKSYLNREQYGDRPLFYGEPFTAPYHYVNGKIDTEKGEALYARTVKTSEKEADSYVHYSDKTSYKHCSEFNMLFPRMYSSQADHVAMYKDWSGYDGENIIDYENNGSTAQAAKPTQLNNLAFFLKYQVGFMYWRYFMWNFVGRQNDIQGHGQSIHGGWCSGIPFIDNLLTGSDEEMPDLLKENKGRNCYYFLPLILGLLGILYQFGSKNSETRMQSFWQVCILFFLTGLAIVIYLNQTPNQPRERDYAYAGSFYAYCIWIGLGVMFLYEGIKRFLDPKIAASLATVIGLGVPVLMAQQNWDDHDRSNRYTCRDLGGNYLRSLAPNAIIFTAGDNDTFPLWYNQEVEGECKNDSMKVQYQNKRVANLSYLQMGWYLTQMTRDAYDSKGFKLTMQEKDYSMGKRDYVELVPLIREPISLEAAFDLLLDDAKQDQIRGAVRRMYGRQIDSDRYFIPCNQFYLEVDSAEAVNNAGAPAKAIHEELNYARYLKQNAILADSSLNLAQKNEQLAKLRELKTYRIDINLSGRGGLTKSDLFILDMLMNNHWERPIYFAVSSGESAQMGLGRYFRLEGMAFRLMPYKFGGRCDIDIMYDNLMNKFELNNINDPKVYLEENNQRMCNTFRNIYGYLASDLIEAGRKDSAKKVLDYVMDKIPASTVPLVSDCTVPKLYYQMKDVENGDKYASIIMKNNLQMLEWIASMNPSKLQVNRSGFSRAFHNLSALHDVLGKEGRKELDDKVMSALQTATPIMIMFQQQDKQQNYSEEEYIEED